MFDEIGIPAGKGFLVGMAVGYVFKKSLKVLLLAIGIGVVVLVAAQDQGLVMLDNAKLQATAEHIGSTFVGWADTIYAKVKALQPAHNAGLVAGFIVGLKMG